MTNHRSTLHYTGDLCGPLLTFLYYIRVSGKESGLGRNDNLPLVGRIYSLETVGNLQIEAPKCPYALHMSCKPLRHSSPIHMVFDVIDVEGYRVRQQSAIVVSEYVPSLKGHGLDSTNRFSTLHCTGDLPLWTTLNLLVLYKGKYRGQWL